jgi:hypothetical protein
MLLSAAFDVDFDFEFGIKTKVKNGGQECPPHTVKVLRRRQPQRPLLAARLRQA